MLNKIFLITTSVFSFAVSASAQTWEREEIKFESIVSRAKDLSNQAYLAPDKEALPDWMKQLNYNQYNRIVAINDQALWAADSLPFRAMFFHPGFIFREPVKINEFTETHQQSIRMSGAYFDYGSTESVRGEIPPNLGFAGFKCLYPLNEPDKKKFDEIVAFIGASYFRALGKGQHYGLSSRGLAVDTGVEGRLEEFPLFREFWLKKPQKDETGLTIYALLDSPSYSGAYSFLVEPGNDTKVSVKATIFARQKVTRLGLAPMSSMFWFGKNSKPMAGDWCWDLPNTTKVIENGKSVEKSVSEETKQIVRSLMKRQPMKFDDYRPEVHDSDGLAIRNSNGERVWRPLNNDSGKIEFSFFHMERCDGFGLLQRERSLDNYEDTEAKYHRRPSLWIEPTTDWGAGSVMLMEMAAHREMDDNIAVMFVPDKPLNQGDRFDFGYTQFWSDTPDLSQAGGYVCATRTSVPDPKVEERLMIVEFKGGKLDTASEQALAAEIQVTSANKDKVKILHPTIYKVTKERHRLTFVIAPGQDGQKLEDIGPVELRACLKRGTDYLTETWVYRITP